MDKKLAIMATIKDGLAIALVNYLSLILTVVLYLVTIWIPYLNVGTTIAVSSLPAEMAKGTVINPLFIFDGKYRRNMGEYFILSALMTGAILVGFLFGIIPGFVISVAWSFAVVLFVDKDMSAMDALHESNRLTYGHKWRIFGTEFLLVLCLELVIVIIQCIFGIGEVPPALSSLTPLPKLPLPLRNPLLKLNPLPKPPLLNNSPHLSLLLPFMGRSGRALS